jgi:hypothetical protein
MSDYRGFWKKDVEIRHPVGGARIVADVFFDGEGNQREVRYKRHLADGEVWPPPQPVIDHQAQAREAARVKSARLNEFHRAILSAESELPDSLRRDVIRHIEMEKLKSGE